MNILKAVVGIPIFFILNFFVWSQLKFVRRLPVPYMTEHSVTGKMAKRIYYQKRFVEKFNRHKISVASMKDKARTDHAFSDKFLLNRIADTRYFIVTLMEELSIPKEVTPMWWAHRAQLISDLKKMLQVDNVIDEEQYHHIMLGDRSGDFDSIVAFANKLDINLHLTLLACDIGLLTDDLYLK